jgi:hypothetical protein
MLALLCGAGAASADDGALLACRKLADTGARLACYDAIPAGAHAGAVPAAKTAEQSFGLQDMRRPEPAASIASTLVGKIDGWGPTTQFTLANGQVWRVSDGSSAVLDPMSNPPLRIVRNAFGTTFIEFDGTNQSAKVKRVR